MPQNIDIGDRNLALSGDIQISTSTYQVAEYFTSEDIIVGQIYTVVLKGTKPSTQNFGLWLNAGSSGMGNFAHKGNNIWTLTFSGIATTSGNERRIRIYQPAAATAGPATIDWLKIVKGDTTSLDFTPSPEDVQGQIDEKAAQIDFDTVLSEQAVALDKIEALNTEINATKDNLIISHSAEYIEKIEKVLGSSENADARLKVLDEQRVQIETYFQFDDAFTIGRSNSKNKVRITNEQMQFLDGETILAYASGNYFFIKNMKVEQALEVGVHKIEEENGITVGRFIGG